MVSVENEKIATQKTEPRLGIGDGDAIARGDRGHEWTHDELQSRRQRLAGLNVGAR